MSIPFGKTCTSWLRRTGNGHRMSAGRTNSEALSQHLVHSSQVRRRGQGVLRRIDRAGPVLESPFHRQRPGRVFSAGDRWIGRVLGLSDRLRESSLRQRPGTMHDDSRLASQMRRSASGAWCRGTRPGTGRHQHPPLEAVGIRRRYVGGVPLRYAPPISGRRQGWRQRRSDVVRHGLLGSAACAIRADVHSAWRRSPPRTSSRTVRRLRRAREVR